MDFYKAEYRGHCYARTDLVWDPKPESKSDSGYPGTVSPNGTKLGTVPHPLTALAISATAWTAHAYVDPDGPGTGVTK